MSIQLSFSRRDPVNSRAFTLIELLVVIAIIAIIASMVMPAVQSALNSARNTQCMNNLKSNGAALEMYINDHNNYYPSYPNSNGLWASQLAKNNSDKSELKYYLIPYLGATNTSGYQATFLCPATSKAPYKQRDNVQYVLNHAAKVEGPTAVDLWGYPDNGQVAKKRLLMTARDWAMSDVDQTFFLINPGWGNYDDFAPYATHITRWNQLYFDWHVGALKR